MTPQQYLLFSLKHNCHYEKAWILSAFTVSIDTPKYRERQYVGQLLKEPYGFFYLDEELKQQPIETKKTTKEPLIAFTDRIKVTPQDFPFIGDHPLEVSSTRLLLNMLVIHAPFQGKLKFIDKEFTPDTVEKIIAPILQSTPAPGEPRDPKAIYVEDYERFTEAVTMVETMGHIFAYSVTPAGLLPAPGRKEFKQQLLKKYEGKLTDPLSMSHFEKELQDFDTEYLKKNDPSFGLYMGKKPQAARLRRFMTQGGESNMFIDQLDVTPLVPSLDEGISLDPVSFTAIGNNIRIGSYSRAEETINGGVAYKTIATALDSGKISDTDCGSKIGIEVLLTEDNVDGYLRRYFILQGKPALIETREQAQPYFNKVVTIRDPAYCLDTAGACHICAGKDLSVFKVGQVIPGAEISSGVMNDALKKMHVSGIATRKFKIENVLF